MPPQLDMFTLFNSDMHLMKIQACGINYNMLPDLYTSDV